MSILIIRYDSHSELCDKYASTIDLLGRKFADGGYLACRVVLGKNGGLLEYYAEEDN